MRAKCRIVTKKSLSILALLFPALICLSCEEDFSPKGEVKPRYVLNCIINRGIDPDAQNVSVEGSQGIMAFLSRTYDIDGYIPSGADSSAYIRNANICIKYLDKDIILKDSTIIQRSRVNPNLTDTTIRYKCYVANKNVFSIEGATARLLATMPDGTELKSELTLPYPIGSFEMKPRYESGITARVPRSSWNKALELNWDYSYRSDCLYFPKLEIIGYVYSTNKPISIEVPCRYTNQNNKSIPVYPGAIRDSKVIFDFEALDSAMVNISKGYADKSDITVTVCKFSVIVYERNLAAYYTSTNGYLDGFSVRLDNNVYSNITGGYGIFGASVYNYQIFRVSRDYVFSFGYD